MMVGKTYQIYLGLQRSLPSADKIQKEYNELQARKRAVAMIVAEAAYEDSEHIVKLLQEKTGIYDIKLLKSSEFYEETDPVMVGTSCRFILVQIGGFNEPFLGIRGTSNAVNILEDSLLVSDFPISSTVIVSALKRFIGNAINEGLIEEKAAINVVGHSLGGIIAKYIATVYPNFYSFSFDEPWVGLKNYNIIKSGQYYNPHNMYTCVFPENAPIYLSGRYSDAIPCHMGVVDRIVFPEKRVSRFSMDYMVENHNIANKFKPLLDNDAFIVRIHDVIHYPTSPFLADIMISSLPGVKNFIESRASAFAGKKSDELSAALEIVYANLDNDLQNQTGVLDNELKDVQRVIEQQLHEVGNSPVNSLEALNKLYGCLKNSSNVLPEKLNEIKLLIDNYEKDSAKSNIASSTNNTTTNNNTNNTLKPNYRAILNALLKKSVHNRQGNGNDSQENHFRFGFKWRFPVLGAELNYSTEHSDFGVGVSANLIYLVRDLVQGIKFKLLSDYQKEIHKVSDKICSLNDIGAMWQCILASKLNDLDKKKLLEVAISHRWDLLPLIKLIYSNDARKENIVKEMRTAIDVWAHVSATEAQYINTLDLLNNPATTSEDILRCYLTIVPKNLDPRLSLVSQEILKSNKYDPHLVNEYRINENFQHVNSEFRKLLRQNDIKQLDVFLNKHDANYPELKKQYWEYYFRNIIMLLRSHDSKHVKKELQEFLKKNMDIVSQLDNKQFQMFWDPTLKLYSSLLKKSDLKEIENYIKDQGKHFPDLKELYMHSFFGTQINIINDHTEALIDYGVVYLNIENRNKSTESLRYQLRNKDGNVISGLLSIKDLAGYQNIINKIKLGSDNKIILTESEINAVINSVIKLPKCDHIAHSNINKLLSFLKEFGTEDDIDFVDCLFVQEKRDNKLKQFIELAVKEFPESNVTKKYLINGLNAIDLSRPDNLNQENLKSSQLKSDITAEALYNQLTSLCLGNDKDYLFKDSYFLDCLMSKIKLERGDLVLGCDFFRFMLSKTDDTQAKRNLETNLFFYLTNHSSLITHEDIKSALDGLRSQRDFTLEELKIRKGLINNQIVQSKEDKDYQASSKLSKDFIMTLNDADEILYYASNMVSCNCLDNYSLEIFDQFNAVIDKIKSLDGVKNASYLELSNLPSVVMSEYVKKSLIDFDLKKIRLIESLAKEKWGVVSDNAVEEKNADVGSVVLRQAAIDKVNKEAIQFCVEGRQLLESYYHGMIADGLSEMLLSRANRIHDDYARAATIVCLGISQLGAKALTEFNKYQIRAKIDTKVNWEQLLKTPSTYYLIASVLRSLKQYHVGIYQDKANEQDYYELDFCATFLDITASSMEAVDLFANTSDNKQVTNDQKINKAISLLNVALDSVIVLDNLYEKYSPGNSFKLSKSPKYIAAIKSGLNCAQNVVSAAYAPDITSMDYYAISAGVQFISLVMELYEPTEQELISKGEYLPDSDYISAKSALRATNRLISYSSWLNAMSAAISLPAAQSAAIITWLAFYGSAQNDLNTLNTYLNAMIAASGFLFRAEKPAEKMQPRTLYLYLSEDNQSQNELKYSSITSEGEVVKDCIITLDEWLASYPYIFTVLCDLGQPINYIGSLVGSACYPLINTSMLKQLTDVNNFNYKYYDNSFMRNLQDVCIPVFVSGLFDYRGVVSAELLRYKQVIDRIKYATLMYQQVINKLRDKKQLDHNEIALVMRHISKKGHCTANVQDYSKASQKILAYMQRIGRTNDNSLQELYHQFKILGMQSTINKLDEEASIAEVMSDYPTAVKLYSSLAMLLNFDQGQMNHFLRKKYLCLFNFMMSENNFDSAEDFLLQVEKLNILESCWSQSFGLKVDKDKLPAKDMYVYFEKGRLFYSTNLTQGKDIEITAQNFIDVGVEKKKVDELFYKLKSTSGAIALEALSHYKNHLATIAYNNKHSSLLVHSELMYLRESLRLYLAKAINFVNNSTNNNNLSSLKIDLEKRRMDDYQLVLNKIINIYSRMDDILKMQSPQEYVVLRNFVESQKNTIKMLQSIAADNPKNNYSTNHYLTAVGLLSFVGLTTYFVRKNFGINNVVQSVIKGSYTNYMNLFLGIFRPRIVPHEYTNLYNPLKFIQSKLPVKSKSLGFFGCGLIGACLYAGYQGYKVRQENVQSQPMVKK